jgi:hypothetical protein
LEVKVLWEPRWLVSLAEQQLPPPQGGVGRKLQAKPQPEEHEKPIWLGAFDDRTRRRHNG